MNNSSKIKNRLLRPVTDFIRHDYALLNENHKVSEALDIIRDKGLGERIVYFYVGDDNGMLKGVIPVRKLLTGSAGSLLSDIMIKKIISLPESATLYEAVEFFVLYKFYALPVLNADGKISGIVDINSFTDEIVSFNDAESSSNVFEYIGFKYSQIKNANPFRAFTYRFPWLLSTVTGGLVCAMLVNFFEATLVQSLMLAFFLALVLSLAESISIQTMTITIQSLKLFRPDFRWYFRSVGKEFLSSVLLGLGAGTIVGIIAAVFFSEPRIAMILAASILASNVMAGIIGLSVPFVLHYLKLDPRIASGPATLALTDVSTLLLYFNVAAFLI